MGWRWGSLLVLCAMGDVASANSDDLYERLWPEMPNSTRLTLSQQITDQLTELGNTIGGHMNVLSNEMLSMTFDGRRRRAFVRLGGGDSRYLEFKLASDVQFAEGKAKINTRIDLAIAGHAMELELPEMEMVPASYRGERGVEVRLPLFKRSF